jgi:hypothetical protein
MAYKTIKIFWNLATNYENDFLLSIMYLLLDRLWFIFAFFSSSNFGRDSISAASRKYNKYCPKIKQSQGMLHLNL